jgi:S1-C subfamily serine protease
MVIEVTPNGPASKAGIKGGNRRAQIGNNLVTVGGDVIVSVNGVNVQDADAAIREIRKMRPGQEIRLGIVRWDGTSETITVILGEKPRGTRARQP